MQPWQQQPTHPPTHPPPCFQPSYQPTNQPTNHRILFSRNKLDCFIACCCCCCCKGEVFPAHWHFALRTNHTTILVNSFKFFPPPNKAAAMQVQVVGHELLFSIIIYLFVGCVKDSKKASDVLDVVRQHLFIFWAKIFILMNPPPRKKAIVTYTKTF